jgi:glycosyltransferase involved in cell wall biosynthesis
MTRIVGVVLVRNEEHFVTWAIQNVAAFCDELIVLDNLSTDATGERLAALEKLHPHLVLHRTEDPNTSHSYVEGFAGKKAWVFGVDGDEIYDPVGLARLRPRLLRGDFDASWRIDGHVLHATRLALDEGRAWGHVTPAAAVLTKLYNFSVLESWNDHTHQRLHGRAMVYRPGFTGDEASRMFGEPWDQADLRCLHLCFFPRSSRDSGSPAKRVNPGGKRANVFRRMNRDIRDFLANPFSRDVSYKLRRYARGPVVERDIAAFGRPRDHLALDPRAAAAEAVLESSWLRGRSR